MIATKVGIIYYFLLWMGQREFGDSFNETQFKDECTFSLLSGMRFFLERNIKKLKEAKTGVSRRKSEYLERQETLDALLEEINTLSQSIKLSIANLCEEEENIEKLETLNSLVLSTVDGVEGSAYMKTKRTSAKFIVPNLLRNYKEETVGNHELRRTTSESFDVVEAKRNFNPQTLNLGRVTIYLDLLRKLQTSSQVDSILLRYEECSNRAKKIHQETINNLKNSTNILKENHKTLEKDVTQWRELSSHISSSITELTCINQTINKGKIIQVRKVGPGRPLQLSAPRPEVRMQKSLKTNLKQLNHHMNVLLIEKKARFQIDKERFQKVSIKELKEYVAHLSTRSWNEAHLLRGEKSAPSAVDLSIMEAMDVDQLLDLVLETQVSCSKNAMSQAISSIFVCTYFYFLSTSELIAHVMDRFCSTPAELDEKADFLVTLVRLQVVSLLHELIVFYPLHLGIHSSDAKCVERFINDLVTPWNKDCANQLLTSLTAARADLDASIQCQYLSTVEPSLSLSTSRSGRLKYDPVKHCSPLVFANQLTLFEWNLFENIGISEFLQQRWSKNKSLAKGLTANTKHFEAMSFWVARSVLSAKTIEKRAIVLRFFVTVSLHLLKLNNFNGLFEIISGLTNVCVYRLNQSWREAGEEYYHILNQLAGLHDKNYELYRTELQRVNPPVLPYVGVYQTELTKLEEGNETYCEGNRVNFFFKFGKIFNVLSGIRTLKLSPFTGFIENAEFSSFLKNLSHTPFDENSYFSISLDFESFEDSNLAKAELTRNIIQFTFDELRNHKFGTETPIKRRRSLRSSTLGRSFKPDKSLNPQPLQVGNGGGGGGKVKGCGPSPKRPPTLKSSLSFSEDPITVEMMDMLQDPEHGVIMVKKQVGNREVSAFSGQEGVKWIARYSGISNDDAIDCGYKLLREGFIFPLLDTEIQIFNGSADLWFVPMDAEDDEPFQSEFDTAVDSAYLLAVAARMKHPQSGMKMKDHKHLFKSYRDCFSGLDCVTWLVRNIPFDSRREAVALANRILHEGLITQVGFSPRVRDRARRFYQFTTK